MERTMYKRKKMNQRGRFPMVDLLAKGDKHLLSVLLGGQDFLRKDKMKKRGLKLIRKIREEGEDRGLNVL